MQCFDLKSFLILNEKNPKWLCPVCNQQARYEELKVDSLMCEVISKTNSNDHSIYFEKDCTWSVKDKSRESVGYDASLEGLNESVICLFGK